MSNRERQRGSHYEVVYTWPSGRKEVRFRRPRFNTDMARQVRGLRRDARRAGIECPYSIRPAH